MKRSQDVDEAPELSREQVRTVITGACILGDTTLDAHIDDLWAAKSDPDRMRHLLDRFHCEVEAARTLLAAAGGPEWWSTVDADRLAAACVAARTWAEGDPTCAELERGFASRLLTVFGVDIAGIPRTGRLPARSSS
ncbi:MULTISPECIES: hypothetical protein [Rathayibacter]|uniref:Uncharacterized protein n=1 Tax=Rathayibacter festucae DSM 15932 TaxID=1328866 RepID=A0A3Q9UVW7_9MICO|nr:MULTISPECIES: hypothetical protein [Rathayibacter]AZZ51803.1 hypothetical protein C1I64_06920 [Rathayibacter festucae DSM 15932]ROQ05649.1 hypothetical protein EDF54_2273 [Rathayibacter sp. PhB93]TDQ12281.1 hypothetical protein EDF17_2134 [Rathayibacter sp. PhB1]